MAGIAAQPSAPPYGLTRRQRETLLVIQELIDAGTPPSFAEICAELEFASRAHAYQTVRRLQARGWLDWRPHCARSFRLLRRLPMPPEPVFVGTFQAPALAAQWANDEASG